MADSLALFSSQQENLSLDHSMTTITFEKWRERFEKSIVGGTLEWEALQQFRGYLKQHASKLQGWLPENPSPADVRLCSLQLIFCYSHSTPQINNERKKRDARTRKALRDFKMQAEKFVSHLRKMTQLNGTPGTLLVSPNHEFWPVIDLSPLLRECESVVESSGDFLSMLEWRFVRKPDVVDQGIGLVYVLKEQCKIHELQAIELTRCALLAHGHSETEVEDIRRQDRVRKRLKARDKRFVPFFTTWMKIVNRKN
jgi:hypothetical protein